VRGLWFGLYLQPVCAHGVTKCAAPAALLAVASTLPRQSTAGIDAAKAGRLPAALTRRYDVYFVPEQRIPATEGEWRVDLSVFACLVINACEAASLVVPVSNPNPIVTRAARLPP